MAANLLLSPLRSSEFTPAAAQHLVNRVGLGALPEGIKEFAELGLDKAVDRLVNYESIQGSDMVDPEIDPDVIEPRTSEERELYRDARRSGDQAAIDELRRMQLAAQAKDRRMTGTLRDWWLGRMTITPRPAEERLTLLWHNHFASSQRSVRDTYLMWKQNQFFRENANGSFATMAAGIVRDPAMIKYLNNDKNNKKQPNENLARELMELFTLGVGNYSEDDIKEGARALTGYNVRDNDFNFVENQHDGGTQGHPWQVHRLRR